MKWVFANNNGGQDSGFHDAGVETFKGNFDRYLARELIQNSLDARLDPNKLVHVRFELLRIKRDEIPDMDTLTTTFRACATFWDHDRKAREFFKRAEQISKASAVTVLRVGDYNTTGVVGADNDRRKNWYFLIRCAGASSKTGDEGGSFGIGKNAPFAASHLRTVLYSTLNSEGGHIFQGVAKLVSHKIPGGIAQPTGFLGGRSGASVRVKENIPATWIRSDVGTDINILGFPATQDWERDLLYSVVENFWPAIDWGDLTVQIGNTAVSRANLQDLLDKFVAADEEFTAGLYYQAYKQPVLFSERELPNLKQVQLYLATGNADLPKRVAMIRRTGMVIFAKQYRSVVPFCGVFICRNETGNKLLREMEPPRHDVWDPDHPDKGANRKIDHEYGNFIRECIKKLMPADENKVIAVPGLSRFLPDDEDTPEESFGEGEQTREETQDRSPLPEKITGKKIDPRRVATQPDETLPGTGTEETEAGVGQGTGGGPGSGTNVVDGGSGAGGGGAGQGSAGEAEGNRGGYSSGPAIPIRYRTYTPHGQPGAYVVSLKPERLTGTKSALISIFAVGTIKNPSPT